MATYDCYRCRMKTWDMDTPGVVRLPAGRTVRGLPRRKLRRADVEPELVIYLQGTKPKSTRWPHLWIKWRDFGVPASTDEAVSILRQAYERAGTQRVAITCSGGIGRTGTAMAALGMIGGVSEEQALSWVRSSYHRRAVETGRQQRWLAHAAGILSSGRK